MTDANVVFFGGNNRQRTKIISMLKHSGYTKDIKLQGSDIFGYTVDRITLSDPDISIYVYNIVETSESYDGLFSKWSILTNVENFLKEVGTINLLVLCTEYKERVTPKLETNYHIFRNYICKDKVPVMLAVTGFENIKQDDINTWKEVNKLELRDTYKLEFCDIVCLALPDEGFLVTYEIAEDSWSRSFEVFAKSIVTQKTESDLYLSDVQNIINIIYSIWNTVEKRKMHWINIVILLIRLYTKIIILKIQIMRKVDSLHRTT